MSGQKKVTGKAFSMPLGLLTGSCVSMGITLSASALLAKLIDTEVMEWDNVGYGIMIMILLASFLGAFISYRKIRRQRMLVCGASGAVYLGILLSITAVFFGGQYEAVGVTAALVLAGSLTAGLLDMYAEGKGKRRKVKIRHR